MHTWDECVNQTAAPLAFFFLHTGTLTYAAPPAGCQDYISAAAGGRETVPLVQTLVTRDH